MKEFSAESGEVLADEPAQTVPTIDSEKYDPRMPLDAIVPSITNRSRFNEVKLLEMAESIKAKGVIHPISIRLLPASRLQETFEDRPKGAPLPGYEIICGERRFRASRLAGLTTIPVLVRIANNVEALELQLIENVQGEDLHELEEAEGYMRLRDEAGIEAKDIAVKIHKSKEYVFARLKLLSLSEVPRRAFLAGDIDMSRALIIARVPNEKLQLKTLEEATRKDYDGNVASVRDLQRWTQQNVMLRLDAARFQITAADLVASAGACRDCPKRTGANPELFSDVGSADVCTDPACYHAKEEAHDEAAAAIAKARGQKVITGKEAQQIWQHEFNDPEGFRRLDKPDKRLNGNKTLAKVLGKDAPEPILLQSPKGDLVPVIPSDKANQVLKAKGLLSPHQVRAQRDITAQEAAQRAQEKFERTWRKRAIAGLFEAVRAHPETGLTTAVVRMLAGAMMAGLVQDDRSHVAQLLGVGKVAEAEGIRAHLKDCSDDQAVAALLLLFMQHDQSWLSYVPEKDKLPLRLEAVAEAYAMSLEHFRAEVRAEDDAAELAREKKLKAAEEATSAKASAAQSKNQGGKTKPGEKPASPAARPKSRKLSLEEAQLGIADAMQSAEAASATEAAGSTAPPSKPEPGGAEAPQHGGAAPATGTASGPAITTGTRVRFKEGLKSPGGKFRKVSGREGTIDNIEGGTYVVRFGPASHQVATASLGELEALAQPTLKLTQAWPFPNDPPAAAAPALAPGMHVQVKADVRGAGKKFAGREGTVTSMPKIGGDWSVEFPATKGGKPTTEYFSFRADELEAAPAVTTKAAAIDEGMRVRVRDNVSKASAEFIGREGMTRGRTGQAWNVVFTAKKKGGVADFRSFMASELEVVE